MTRVSLFIWYSLAAILVGVLSTQPGCAPRNSRSPGPLDLTSVGLARNNISFGAPIADFSDLSRSLLREENRLEALSFLADRLRTDPADQRAAYVLLALLLHHDFAWPGSQLARSASTEYQDSLPSDILFHPFVFGSGLSFVSLPRADSSSLRLAPLSSQIVDPNPSTPVKVFNTLPRRSLPSFAGPARTGSFVQFSDDGAFMAMLAGRAVQVWDTRTARLAFRRNVPPGAAANGLLLSPGGQQILVLFTKSQDEVWPVSNNNTNLLSLKRHGSWGADSSFNTSATRLVRSWPGGVTQLFDLAQRKMLWETNDLVTPLDQTNSVAYLGDSPFVLTRGSAEIRILNAENGSLAASLRLNEQTDDTWTLSQDGSLLALSGRNGHVQLRSLPSLQMIGELRLEAAPAQLRFTPGQKLLGLLLPNGRGLRIWDWRSGQVPSEIVQPHGLNLFAFSPDSSLVAVTSFQSSQVFELSTGYALTPSIDLPAFLSTVDFRWANQQVLAFRGAEGTLVRVELPVIPAPVPSWLLELPDGITKPASGQRLLQLATILRGNTQTNAYTTFARWFLADRETRPVAPNFPDKTGELIASWAKAPATNLVLSALALAPTNQAVLARAAEYSLIDGFGSARYRKVLTPDERHFNASNDFPIAQRLTTLYPTNAWGQVLLAHALERSDQPASALAVLDKFVAAGNPLAFAWAVKARCLERTDPRLATSAWETALTNISKRKGFGRPGLASHLRQNLELLGQLGRAGEVHCQSLEIPVRPSNMDPRCVDLSLTYTAVLANWKSTNEVEDLSSLRVGLTNFAGVSFELRGLVQPQFAEAIKPNLSVRQSARAIHFLHGSTGGQTNYYGKRIGHYVVHFADRTTEIIPMSYGQHVQDWTAVPVPQQLAPESVVAWTGRAPHSKRADPRITLYKLAWPNPKAHVQVDRIELVSETREPAFFTVAVTVEN